MNRRQNTTIALLRQLVVYSELATSAGWYVEYELLRKLRDSRVAAAAIPHEAAMRRTLKQLRTRGLVEKRSNRGHLVSRPYAWRVV